MKKKLLAAAVALMLLFVGKALYRLYRERNVFDQMYYARVHTHYDWWSPGYVRKMFANMKQLMPISRDSELSFTIDGWFYESYRPEYLAKNNELLVEFRAESKRIDISYEVNKNKANNYRDYRWYYYEYRVDEKALTYTTNDPADADNNKAFLYEIFLRDWFEANPDTRFSLEYLGPFECDQIAKPWRSVVHGLGVDML